MASASLVRPAADAIGTRTSPRTARERSSLVDDLEDSSRWPAAAASLLAELGYRLLAADPASGGTSHLLVALRAQPTRRHFDPEAVSYFAPTGRIAALATLDRAAATRSSCQASAALWGHVHVIDRVPVENRFITFGGEVRVAQVDRELTIVDLRSPAPIVRWGGHSQATDELAEAVGAFFGRLIVPVNYMAGAAEKVDAARPEILYRAFLIDVLAREAQALRRGAPATRLHAWLLAAWHRMERDAAACSAARTLLLELGFGSPTA